MTEDVYMIAIAALLPLSACMLVLQVNPYHALVIRGILGSIAALVYVLFGAADVALTEALVGTMLSITLYAVAVRSSMSMRVGVLDTESKETPKELAEISKSTPASEQLLSVLRKSLSKFHMRLELVTYSNFHALQTALTAKEIHTAYVLSEQVVNSESPTTTSLRSADEQPFYHIQTRVQRLYDLMQADLPPTLASLTYIDLASPNPVNTNNQPSIGIPALIEDQP